MIKLFTEHLFKQPLGGKCLVEQTFSCFHASFSTVCEKLNQLKSRFPLAVDEAVFKDLYSLYSNASKNYLDHRTTKHLFRIILSMNLMRKSLLPLATFPQHQRNFKLRWLPTELSFPFISKSVLGCLIGFNSNNRYELFDEESVKLSLQKHLPHLSLIKGSFYRHLSSEKTLKIFYLEIGKTDGSHFSFAEQTALKAELEEKIKNSVQILSPKIFMRLNEEEVYKNILTLSQEIQSKDDLPQAYMSLDGQTGQEILFRLILVYVSSLNENSLQERCLSHSFVLERSSKVRYLSGHPIEANVFCLSLPRTPSLLRSDGALDFYLARQKVAALLKEAIGEFRDYNGGLFVKQQELLKEFKKSFSDVAKKDPEFIEGFFYELNPIEKQSILPQEVLKNLFFCFLKNSEKQLPKHRFYSLTSCRFEGNTYITVYVKHFLFKEKILTFFQTIDFTHFDIVYNFIEREQGIFFNLALLEKENQKTTQFLKSFKEALESWQEKLQNQQTLKIALELSPVSLDPRIGGESGSVEILRLLFTGLVRLNKCSKVEKALAESITISPDRKQYIFKLRPSFWNDGSPLSAYDFEYAWKKILSPHFKTSFASFFYPIKHAKEVKSGQLPAEQLGIQVIDELTLQVDLGYPAPYFLELMTHPLYSPVHRLIDQKYPHWPHESGRHYLCNGPFQMETNQPTQGYLLTKNPFYWNKKEVELEEIILTCMQSPQAMQAFQKEDIDWMGYPFGGHSDFLDVDKQSVVTFPFNKVCWSVFNTSLFPFHCLKIRQAFAYAIQRHPMTCDPAMGIEPAYSPLLPNPVIAPRPLFPEYDPEKARRLLYEGVKELQISFKDLDQLEFIFVGKGISERIAESLYEQIKACLGIKLKLKSLPWNQLFQKIEKQEFQAALIYWSSWIDDPINILYAFKASQENVNFSRWECMEYQELLALSDHELNVDQRALYLKQAETMLCNEMPIIPLYYQSAQAVVKKKFHSLKSEFFRGSIINK